MRGYTAKVGLRKSRLHFDTLLARKIVRRSPESDTDFRWLERAFGDPRDFKGFGGLDTIVDESGWLRWHA